MKRALLITSALLVLVVGLAVAQEKPEPKRYMSITVSFMLERDDMEPTAKKELYAAYDSIGVDFGHPSWVPATQGYARASRKRAWERDSKLRKRQEKTSPLGSTDQERVSTFTVITNDAIPQSVIFKAQETFLSLTNNPMYGKPCVGVQITSTPFFTNPTQ